MGFKLIHRIVPLYCTVLCDCTVLLIPVALPAGRVAPVFAPVVGVTPVPAAVPAALLTPVVPGLETVTVLAPEAVGETETPLQV
jgi:hypothetical protein